MPGVQSFKEKKRFFVNHSLIIRCLTVSWSSLCFLGVYIHAFHQIWEVFSCYFFKHSLLPLSLFSFPNLTRCICWFAWWRHADPLGSVHFSSVFFLSLPQPHNFHCHIFRFTDSLKFKLLYFSAPAFLFNFFLGFLSLYFFFLLVNTLIFQVSFFLPFGVWASFFFFFFFFFLSSPFSFFFSFLATHTTYISF